MSRQPPEPGDEPMDDVPTNGDGQPAAAHTVIDDTDEEQCLRIVGAAHSSLVDCLIYRRLGLQAPQRRRSNLGMKTTL